MNRLWRDYPHKVLQAFTLVAGKYGVVGDSRLGHSTIAAGRRIPQDLEIISESIQNKSFYRNKILLDAIEHAKKHNSNLHLLGLISNGGVHAHINHLIALIELCYRQNFSRVFVDAITDGIDTGPNDSLSLISKIKEKMTETGIGQFSSVIGRDFAMDRVGDYKKTKVAYELLVEGVGEKYSSINAAVADNYQKQKNDFTLDPAIITEDGKTTPIKENDALVFFNFRPDRSEQICKMLTGTGGKSLFYSPKKINNLFFTSFCANDEDNNLKSVFPKIKITGTLGEILANYKEKQLRIAESEKQAHVTSFFNCGQDQAFNLEERKIIPSKKVDNQVKNPVMEAPKITSAVMNAIKSKNYDFILVNFANVDMLSHTGDMIAAGKAIRVVDEAVGKIIDVNIRSGGATIITADHGNIEEMVKLNPQQDPETKHTLNPVPFIYITADNKKNLIKSAVTSSYSSLSKIISAKETLADIAPTILEIMGLPKGKDMTGHSLLNRLE